MRVLPCQIAHIISAETAKCNVKLQEQVQCQGQKGRILVFPTVTCHKQQEKDYNQVFRVEIPWEQASKKIGDTKILLGFLRTNLPFTGG